MSRTRYPWYMRAANEPPLGRTIALGTIKFLWWLFLVAALGLLIIANVL